MAGQWADKFERAERRWQSFRMTEYAPPDRVLPAIIQDKARLRADHVAFRFRDADIRWGAFDAGVNRAANGLWALGVRPGDKVAMMLPNCPEFLTLWFAINRIGAANVPVNIAQRGEGLAWQIDSTDCVALIADAAYLPHVEAIADRLPKVRHLILRGAAQEQVGRMETLALTDLDRGEETPDVAVHHTDLSTILFTSGTTGRSKGVMIGHDYWYQVWEYCARTCRYTDEDVLYTGLPLFHSSAKGTTVGPAILADAQSVIVERFSASRMMEDARTFGATEAKYIGGIIPILLKQPERPEDADNPLRLMVGAAAPVNLWDAFEKRFNTRLLEMYGMTECTACLINPFDARRPGSCGKPITGWDVRLVDETGAEVPPNVTGEITARPRHENLGAQGYYGDPAATADLIRDGWYYTGDLARRDADGYVYYVDRRKQALRRRGENISSFEVETVLNAHPAVLESCIVGVPAEMGEEEVKAVVVLKAGAMLTPEDLVAWCSPRMAYFAVPRYIAFRATLPKTPSERVEKYRLKAEGVTPDCWDREAAGIVLAR